MAAAWSGIAGTARSLWVAFDAVVIVAMEPLLIANLWWAAISVPVWGVLALATYSSSRGSRMVFARMATAGDDRTPEVTTLGLRAVFLAGVIVAIALLAAPLSVLAGQSAVYVVLSAFLAYDALSVMLVVRLIRLNLDLYRNGRVAGRQPLVAYLLAMAGAPWALWAGWVLAYVVAGLTYRPSF